MPSAKQIPPQLKFNGRKTGTVFQPVNNRIAQQFKQKIRKGRATKSPLRLQLINAGFWTGSRPNSMAITVCEKKKEIDPGKSQGCWQAKSDIYNAVRYSGTMSTTNQGFTCAPWNDESVHPHKDQYKIRTHNYCRSFDDSETPWCYTTDPDMKYDECPIPECQQPTHEFDIAQADCGKRPVIMKDCNSPPRIIGMFTKQDRST